MIARADIITQGDPTLIADQWAAAMETQAALPGFVEARLHRVYRLINKTDYRFLSVVQWRGAEDHAASLPVAGAYGFLTSPPTDPMANTYTLFNSAKGPETTRPPDHITVINPYRIAASEEHGYAEMWDQSARHMASKDGFIDAQFYRACRNGEPYHFVSRAAWRSEDAFMKQFEGADFRTIVAPYEGIFCISLSRLAGAVPSAAAAASPNATDPTERALS